MKKIILGSLLAILFFSAGCFFSGEDKAQLNSDNMENSGKISYDALIFCQTLVENRGCKEDISIFSPNTPMISASFLHKDAKKGDRFRGEWYSPKKEKFASFEVVMEKDLNPIIAYSISIYNDNKIAAIKNWPEGEYELRVYKNEEKDVLTSKKFNIAY